jgi:conjugal transfer pilus assembly protein TraU
VNKLVSLVLLSLLATLPARAMGPESPAQFYNPISDTNWGDMFPITIGGVRMGGDQPPTIFEPTVCICPSHFFGYPIPGFGITYWEPAFVVEVTRHPGRLTTLGQNNVLGNAYDTETGPGGGNSAKGDHEGEDRKQVHWYSYPLFRILGVEINSLCTNDEGGFDLAAITEVDPSWQNDVWAAVLSPENAMFANPIMQATCAVDALAAAVSYPLDPLFWCAGAWGTVYPFSGNPHSTSSDQQSNALTLSKFLARQFRTGMMLDTIGPQATCSAQFSPVWVKTQFRVDPIYPHPTFGHPIYVGQTEFRWGMIPPANYPLWQDSSYLLWVAHQCCLRF